MWGVVSLAVVGARRGGAEPPACISPQAHQPALNFLSAEKRLVHALLSSRLEGKIDRGGEREESICRRVVAIKADRSGYNFVQKVQRCRRRKIKFMED